MASLTVMLTGLAAADADALLSMDRRVAEELWVAGLPAWQALAGAVRQDNRPLAKVRYDAAPRGVGYFVVDWALSPSS